MSLRSTYWVSGQLKAPWWYPVSQRRAEVHSEGRTLRCPCASFFFFFFWDQALLELTDVPPSAFLSTGIKGVHHHCLAQESCFYTEQPALLCSRCARGLWTLTSLGSLHVNLRVCENGPLSIFNFLPHIYLKASNIFLVTIFFSGIPLKVFILLCNKTDAEPWISFCLWIPFWTKKILLI